MNVEDAYEYLHDMNLTIADRIADLLESQQADIIVLEKSLAYSRYELVKSEEKIDKLQQDLAIERNLMTMLANDINKLQQDLFNAQMRHTGDYAELKIAYSREEKAEQDLATFHQESDILAKDLYSKIKQLESANEEYDKDLATEREKNKRYEHALEYYANETEDRDVAILTLGVHDYSYSDKLANELRVERENSVDQEKRINKLQQNVFDVRIRAETAENRVNDEPCEKCKRCKYLSEE